MFNFKLWGKRTLPEQVDKNTTDINALQIAQANTNGLIVNSISVLGGNPVFLTYPLTFTPNQLDDLGSYNGVISIRTNTNEFATINIKSAFYDEETNNLDIYAIEDISSILLDQNTQLIELQSQINLLKTKGDLIEIARWDVNPNSLIETKPKPSDLTMYSHLTMRMYGNENNKVPITNTSLTYSLADEDAMYSFNVRNDNPTEYSIRDGIMSKVDFATMQRSVLTEPPSGGTIILFGVLK